MSKAVGFREVNMILTAPQGKEGEVYNLPVMSDGVTCTSCWQLSDEEIAYIVENKKVWVQVMGQTHPPMVVLAENVMRDDITDFTQFRIRNGKPTLESIVKSGVTEVTVMFMDGQRVWERPHNIIDANSEQYRKDVAEKLLEIIAKGVVDANEGFAKMNSHKLYNILFKERDMVPDILKFGIFIKREKFVMDMRNDTLPAKNFEDYMFLE